MLGRQSSLARPNPVGAGAWDALKPAQASTYETVAIMKGNEKIKRRRRKVDEAGGTKIEPKRSYRALGQTNVGEDTQRKCTYRALGQTNVGEDTREL